MIVTKAVKMAEMMNIPVLGLVENYSYLTCPDCGKKIEVFGKSKIDAVAKELGIPVLCKLPIDPMVAQAMDEGLLEHAKVAVVPGIGFGADAFVRLSYAVSMETLQEGFRRIRSFVDRLA